MRLRSYACASRSVTQSGCRAGKARRHTRSRGEEVERERERRRFEDSRGVHGTVQGWTMWHSVIASRNIVLVKTSRAV